MRNFLEENVMDAEESLERELYLVDYFVIDLKILKEECLTILLASTLLNSPTELLQADFEPS